MTATSKGTREDPVADGSCWVKRHHQVDLNGSGGSPFEARRVHRLTYGRAEPQLAEALALCRKRKATLVIAKLDRLTRSVAFISTLMESKVKFVACDMPDASKFELHIRASLAEEERRLIGERTSAALQAKRLQVPPG